ncbi:DNA-binding protein [Streptomyces clavuligerus]|nr:DNA-binding protein [Streptomyces clavuligerus]
MGTIGGMASLNVGNLGEYLREQRRTAQLSLRQLADAAGVSNPYLSQIERGLRKPSAEVLQQVAKALRISAETLYVRAGILDERDRDELETRAVIIADPSINERQKAVLLQIYDSFRKENAVEAEAGYPAPGADGAAGADRCIADAGAGTGPGTGTDPDPGTETDPETDPGTAPHPHSRAAADTTADGPRAAGGPDDAGTPSH